MARACGILVAVNDNTTDNTVESDSVDWVSKIANVKIGGGGGSWWRQGKPWTAQVDFAVPLVDAKKIRTITIAVTYELGIGSAYPTGTLGPDGFATAYRIVFSGDLIAIKGKAVNLSEGVQVTFADEMSGVLNRRSRLALSSNSGIRTLLSDLNTDMGTSYSGSNQWPANASYLSLDRPAQEDNANGAWIKKALAGHGTNMSCDWDNATSIEVTGNGMRWRPDYFDASSSWGGVTTTSRQIIGMGYPWLHGYTDIGLAYGDFTARVNVEGQGSGGTKYYGWARHLSAIRTSMSNRETSLSTWIDSAAGCEDAAEWLITRAGEPDYLRPFSTTIDIEHMYRVMDDQGSANDPRDDIYKIAGMMLGDLASMRATTWDDTNASYGAWPAHAPDNGDLSELLYDLWHPTLNYDAASEVTDYIIVREITRKWNPTQGWQITFGGDPDSNLSYTEPASSGQTGNGSY